MATDGGSTTTNTADNKQLQSEKRHRSIFDFPADFFDGCRLIPPAGASPTNTPPFQPSEPSKEEESLCGGMRMEVGERWSCNTCKAEFESLLDQRSHFKSDIHRFNVKLTLAGKDIVKEEDLDELTSDSFPKDFDISSISGSEDENDKALDPQNRGYEGSNPSVKQKLSIRTQLGERFSLWKCLVLRDSENVSYENDESVSPVNDGCMCQLREVDVIEKLKYLVHEPRDKSHLRIVLLASGGHFAGCVFDGNVVVAHKTFHRYVVRAKAGKKQSSKDAGGKSIHSAGASLRRHNELALKKDIQDLLASWKSFFDASSSAFIYAPSNKRQLFYNAEKPLFGACDVRSIPLNVKRPTFKEARRLYNQLIQVSYEVDEQELPNVEDMSSNARTISNANPRTEEAEDQLGDAQAVGISSSFRNPDEKSTSGESEREDTFSTTPLHEAAKSGDAQKVLELLEQDCDPSIKGERGKTPYMLATEKEVRNTFRRFMALNLDKWDWHAAKVPSALTNEMEESQATKQAEKNAKRKARSKELKKLRRAREKEKKAQAEATESQNSAAASGSRNVSLPSAVPPKQSGSQTLLSKEEELKKKLAEEREKRAAAAEQRIAAAQGTSLSNTSSMAQPIIGTASDTLCSCCKVSLAGKIPFHRYNYKYCSSSCMHVHRKFLEDG